MSKFASLQDMSDYLRDNVRSEEELAIFLEMQMNAFDTWEENGRCWQRSVVSTHDNLILGTICACPLGKHKDGIGCTRSRVDCSIARKWEALPEAPKRRRRRNIKLEDLKDSYI